MPNLSNFQIDQLARPLLEIARKFYENPDNVQKYIAWHIKKYGVPPKSGIGIDASEN